MLTSGIRGPLLNWRSAEALQVRRALTPLAKQRERLAAVEQELAQLQAQYELAMSAFRFDEANGLQCRIADLERERMALTAVVPPSIAASEPLGGVVPVLRRSRRLRRR